ncbi:MAG: alpha/beta hydrolase [Sterolibacteriaceae bacterium MAG5]|nr:alpha/beta hydrolase [Candidatus Nitricoxidireducens bremensis]
MSDLHPDSVAFLELLAKAGGTPFHEMPLEVQRSASEKMMFAFRPMPPEVARATEAGMARPDAAGGPLRYRLYRPLGSGPEERLPALVWYHGGGCVVGNIESYDSLCRELANRSGCAVVAASYRLAPEAPFPAAVEDAFFALQWTAAHADALHLDASRLAVGGDSAGGYLAIVAALLARDGGGPALRFQLLVYPGTDQRGERDSHRRYGQGYLLSQDSLRYFQRCYFRDDAERLDWRASPILAPTLAGLPPALVLTASHDPIVDDCRAYAERLAAEGVAVRYAEYAGQLHGFFALGKAFREAGSAVAEAAAALGAALRPDQVA